ncbi:26855_t:CDS:1, partial [Racocetra persica]
LKQSKLQLSSENINRENIASGLTKVRIKCKKSLKEIVQDSVETHGKEEVTKIFLELCKFKR